VAYPFENETVPEFCKVAVIALPEISVHVVPDPEYDFNEAASKFITRPFVTMDGLNE
jgi:hypothetical protein